jgi:hypothetical protein
MSLTASTLQEVKLDKNSRLKFTTAFFVPCLGYLLELTDVAYAGRLLHVDAGTTQVSNDVRTVV